MSIIRNGVLAICFVLFSLPVFADNLSGVISVKGKVPSGVLYIFAKKHDGSMAMPLAVKRINTPKFPLKFQLSAADKMVKSIPFTGPFKVVARISPSGDAMDRNGVEVETKKPLKLGAKKIKLVLGPKKKQ